MIVVLTGVSGAGKSTVGEWLRKRFGDTLKPVISVTTRAPRDDDPLGEYAYVSMEQFQRTKAEGKFIWSVCPFGTDWYGTLFESLEETKLKPNTVFLLILEPDSVGTLHIHAERMGLEVVYFYIVAPSAEELYRRLEDRTRRERNKKYRKILLQGRSSDAWEWLVEQRKKDAITVERRIRDCQKWDERALESKIPYMFVRNDLDDTGAIAAATIATEIVERMSA